jgi:hypothetical protein
MATSSSSGASGTVVKPRPREYRIGASYVVQSIERAGAAARGRFIYLDARLKIVRADEPPGLRRAAYDPRQRPWFQTGDDSLVDTGEDTALSVLLQPQGRHHPGQPCQVVDTRWWERTSSCIRLGMILARRKVTPGSEMVLVNSQGYVLAFGDLDRMVMASPESDAAPALARA